MSSEDQLLLEFASCNRQKLPQDFWPQLAALRPTAFLWTGDAAYASDNSAEAQRAALHDTKRGMQYAAFAAQTPIYGTWDDHGKRSLVLSCAVLCCAMLSCAVLCCTVLSCPHTLCICAMGCHVMLLLLLLLLLLPLPLVLVLLDE
jgi:hypothetical protein